MYEYKCKLLRIVDGDTIDVDIDLGFSIHQKNRIRLSGIDTPEIRTRDTVEKKRGFAAKNRLAELLPEEFIIRTKYDNRGKYGRVLGTLIVDDVNINELLVLEGHAIKI